MSPEIPTSMPTIRATTTMALARPCTSSSVLARIAPLIAGRASPNPKPPTTSGMVDDTASRESMSHWVIQMKLAAARSMPTAVTSPAL